MSIIGLLVIAALLTLCAWVMRFFHREGALAVGDYVLLVPISLLFSMFYIESARGLDIRLVVGATTAVAAITWHFLNRGKRWLESYFAKQAQGTPQRKS
jgi:hypothetical protein